MYSFRALYSVINNLSIFAGFCFPGVPNHHINCVQTLFVYIYTTVSVIPIVYMAVCNIVIIYSVDMFDIKFYGLITTLAVPIFDTYYYLFRKHEFLYLLQNFDNITRSMIKSDLIRSKDITLLLKKSKIFNRCLRYCLLWILLELFSLGIYFLGSHFLYSQNLLFHDVPYTVTSETAFLLTTFLHIGAGWFSSSKLIVSWSVIFLMLYHTMFYLKALRKSFVPDFKNSTKIETHYEGEMKCGKLFPKKRLIQSMKNNIFMQHNLSCYNDVTSYASCTLQQWVELHQKIMG